MNVTLMNQSKQSIKIRGFYNYKYADFQFHNTLSHLLDLCIDSVQDERFHELMYFTRYTVVYAC